jgi:hypothetical protein
MIKKTIIFAIIIFLLYFIGGCLNHSGYNYPYKSYQDYAMQVPFPSDSIGGFRTTIKLVGRDTIAANGDSLMIMRGEIVVNLIPEYPLHYMNRYRLEIDSFSLFQGVGRGLYYFNIVQSYKNKILSADIKSQLISYPTGLSMLKYVARIRDTWRDSIISSIEYSHVLVAIFVDDEIYYKIYDKNNYLSPFGPSSTIGNGYSLSESSYVKIEIYNDNGEKVEESIKGVQGPGYYELDYGYDNLPPGKYSYKIRIDGWPTPWGGFLSAQKYIINK